MAGGLHPLRVLIVDDTAAMRLVVQTILTAAGLQKPIHARDGAEAFGILLDREVDLIITDLAMDRLDGLDLVHAVRRHSQSSVARIPIILLTGHAEPHVVRAAVAAGVQQVLAKPVTPSRLLTAVEVALAGGGEEARTRVPNRAAAG